MSDPELRASVVLAVYNEAENVALLCNEILEAMAPVAPFEVVWVDDGSSDDTAQILQTIAARDPRVRVLRHDRRCGQSQAVRTGVVGAAAPWIATLDGDGQNDPADLPAMLEAAWKTQGTSPLVAGIRVRRDDPVSRLIAARVANAIRAWVLNDHCPDTGCGVKVFRRQDFLLLPCFGSMHRYLPALFGRYGHPLINHPVKHRARMKGTSKYTNWGRALVGVWDLMGVFWLTRRTTAPRAITENKT